MTRDPRQEQGNAGEIAQLVATLHETYGRLDQLIGNRTDMVIHAPSGTTYLMPAAQDELRRMEVMERRFATERAAILDALPAEVVILDARGRILTINQAWRQFGLANDLPDPDRFLERNYLDICDAATGPETVYAAGAADGIRRVLAGRTGRFVMEYPCHSPRQERWFLMVVSPLEAGGDGGAVVMHVDISERVRAEARAEDLRQRLERLIDQARVGILVHCNFVPILANRQLAEMFGYEDPDEILALPDCSLLFDESELERVRQYNAERLAGESPPSFYRVVGKRRDGRRMTLENRAFTIQWDNRPAVCGMFNDITDQLDMEAHLRQAQRLDAIGQLTGGVAHDFNNLLTVILGNSELLAARLDEARLRGLAETTGRAARRGAELTNRLLAFARRQPLDPRSTDIRRQVMAMDSLLRRTLGEHIEIEMKHSPDAWNAMVDPGQLENALLNLCINARDAMPDGGDLTIEIANVVLDSDYVLKSPDVAPGRYVMVAVSDTGTGMDEATREHAFDPFFTTKAIDKGSGLGLSMVYGFIKQSRGHVRIYSEPGHGTTVRLYLPYAEGDADPVAVAGSEEAVPTGTEQVLVVEDDDLLRDHVVDQLTGLGYRVIATRNGPEALEVIRTRDDLDLLFTDIVMPGGMSGRDLADAALELRPTLPVLFTSGYTQDAIVHQGRLDPGVQLLPKPYRRQELAVKVRQVLDSGTEYSGAGKPPSR